MSVTTSYSWSSVVSSFLVNQVTGGEQVSPTVAAYPDGKYLVAWGDAEDLFHTATTISGRVVGADGAPIGNQFQVNTTTANAQFGPAAARFNGSSIVVAFRDQSTDANGDVRFRFFDPDGTPQGNDVLVVNTKNGPVAAHAVSGLSNGGFVVAVSGTVGSDDVHWETLDATGALVHEGEALGGTQSKDNPAVAGLANGGFAVVYQQVPYISNDVQLAVALVAEGSAGGPKITLDETGSINRNPKVVALKDGGFAVAYEDNQYNISGTEVSLLIVNADGSKRTVAPIQVNTTNTAGDQIDLSITTLSNGFIVVGWKDSGDGASAFEQAFKPDGTAVADNHVITGSLFDSSIAALNGGQLANVWESTIPDGDGHAIRSSIDELSRTITSDGASDTMIGGQDTLKDHFVGGGGTDTVTYAAVASKVVVDLTNPTANGGAAAGDTFSGVENLTGSAFNDKLSGDDGGNTLVGLAGDDSLKGGKGADVLKGGKGADTLKGGKGGDTLNGGKGADKLYAGKGDSHDVFVFHKHDSGIADGSVDRIYGFDRQSGNEKVHDLIDLSALHVTLGDIDLSVGKHSTKLLIDYHGSHKPDMVIEVMKIDDLNPGDLTL